MDNTLTYRCRNTPVPGDGYVTGILFYPHWFELSYTHAAIGSIYRFRYTSCT